MKVREQVTAEKLRGGFYSPRRLVEVCLDRLAELTAGREGLDLLEPSAGDGAFLRGLADHTLGSRVRAVLGVELLDSEASKAAGALQLAGKEGHVIAGSFLPWAAASERKFDLAVGNPPFVRFQFVTEKDRAALPALSERLGLSFAGVSNLWIPILLGALDSLRAGGAFAFIVPSECFTGVSARAVRRWVAANASCLRVDLFQPGSFPVVLQEVVVLSGLRHATEPASSPRLEVREHLSGGAVIEWSHVLDHEPTWTRLLLEPAHLDALNTATALPAVKSLGLLARFGVAAVTGANDYFCVDTGTLDSYALRDWSRPLLPRIRWATGLTYTTSDHGRTELSTAKSHLLDFAADRPDPTQSVGAGVYLGMGTAARINERFKCRIRQPWYRVPHIRPGRLMLSKRSHRFPRLVLNEAGVVTTDTIYRGEMQPAHQGREADLVAAFHNSLTLLSAELEGRSFGGGVLELVPSEVARLKVPLPEGFALHLESLDARARAPRGEEGEEVVDATDSLLIRAEIGLDRELLATLREGRLALVRRRLART